MFKFSPSGFDAKGEFNLQMQSNSNLLILN